MPTGPSNDFESGSGFQNGCSTFKYPTIIPVERKMGRRLVLSVDHNSTVERLPPLRMEPLRIALMRLHFHFGMAIPLANIQCECAFKDLVAGCDLQGGFAGRSLGKVLPYIGSVVCC